MFDSTAELISPLLPKYGRNRRLAFRPFGTVTIWHPYNAAELIQAPFSGSRHSNSNTPPDGLAIDCRRIARGLTFRYVMKLKNMNQLEDISTRRKQAHARLLALRSKVYEGFLQMEKAAYSDGALPKKQKELIAVGISVVKDCESCMQWHIEQAALAGATFEEVFEAVEVGIEMGGGPATVSARFALQVMDSLKFEARERQS